MTPALIFYYQVQIKSVYNSHVSVRWRGKLDLWHTALWNRKLPTSVTVKNHWKMKSWLSKLMWTKMCSHYSHRVQVLLSFVWYIPSRTKKIYWLICGFNVVIRKWKWSWIRSVSKRFTFDINAYKSYFLL